MEVKELVRRMKNLDKKIRSCQECPLKYYKFGCNKEVCIEDYEEILQLEEFFKEQE
ncbi:MAG: hypothetical protein ACLR02_09985 [Clostridium sp.]